mgnify:CR=1 FL=1
MSDQHGSDTETAEIGPREEARQRIRESKRNAQRGLMKGLVPGVIFMSALIWIGPIEFAGFLFAGISVAAFIAVSGIRYDDSGILTAFLGFWVGSLMAFMLSLMYATLKPVVEYYWIFAL